MYLSYALCFTEILVWFSDTSILYKGLNPEIQKLKLPTGDPLYSYTVCVTATISDRYAVKTTVELRATVSGLIIPRAFLVK